jgi:uncharacterized membrane protein YeaQ/YmgE (transglycosylase-associated protein family)
MSPQTRDLVVLALIGIVAGWLASVVVGGGGLLRYLVTGVIGSFVGGYVLGALGIDLGVRNAFLSRVLTATIGAIIVVVLARIIA